MTERTNAHDGDPLRAIGFSTVAGGQIVSGGEDRNLRSWSLGLSDTGFQALDHVIYDLAASLDGSVVVTGVGGWNGGTDTDTLRVWHANGSYGGTRAPIGYVYSVAISPGNDWIVGSGFYGDIVVYDTDFLELHTTRSTKKKRTRSLELSPNGSILASTSTASRIQFWSFPQNECIPQSCELSLLPVTLSHSGSGYFPIAFSPLSTTNTTEIVSGSVLTCLVAGWFQDRGRGSGDITVYNATSLEVLFHNQDAHSGRINDLAFSPGGTLIASAGADGALRIWGSPEP